MQSYDIALASDHAGYLLKKDMMTYLSNKNHIIIDFGTYSEERVDYPDYTRKVTNSILSGESLKGVLICGTGIGMSIAANRITGIRAALCNTAYMVEMARLHNDANILVLGSRVISTSLAFELIDRFLNTKFEGGRHNIRLSKI